MIMRSKEKTLLNVSLVIEVRPFMDLGGPALRVHTAPGITYHRYADELSRDLDFIDICKIIQKLENPLIQLQG